MPSSRRKSILLVTSAVLALAALSVAWLCYENHRDVAIDWMVPVSEDLYLAAFNLNTRPGMTTAEVIRQINAQKSRCHPNRAMVSCRHRFSLSYGGQRIASAWRRLQQNAGDYVPFAPNPPLLETLISFEDQSPPRELSGAELRQPLRAGDVVWLLPLPSDPSFTTPPLPMNP